ncbi:MAG: alpha/beta fold hydrolase [Acidobacteriota bacterium]
MNEYPIVLAHGIARFDVLTQRLKNDLKAIGVELEAADNDLNYFKDVARDLARSGFDVFESSVSFSGDVELRAKQLKTEIEKFLSNQPGQDKVHIIGHSMGGLDARHMIVSHGMAEKVASMTTIGTPHLGTSFADWGMKNGGSELIAAMSGVLDMGGFDDLATEACRGFSTAAEEAEAANDVVYRTYAGSQPRGQVFGPLKGSWDIIHAAEGDNDGLVPVSSQRWVAELSDGNGKVKEIVQKEFPLPVDHLNECGWWDIDQIKLFDLIKGDIFETMLSYEQAVRDVYKTIAADVRQL